MPRDLGIRVRVTPKYWAEGHFARTPRVHTPALMGVFQSEEPRLLVLGRRWLPAAPLQFGYHHLYDAARV